MNRILGPTPLGIILNKTFRSIVFFLIGFGVFGVLANAQTVEFTQGSKSANTVNLNVPLANYPGRGIDLPVRLNYSSKVWRISYISSPYANGTWGQVRRAVTEAIYAEHSTAGWTTSLDIPKVVWPRSNDYYSYTGKPYHLASASSYRIPRVYIHMPDGSAHELRKSDQPYQSSGFIDMVGTFYGVDGSRIRYDSTGESTGTLYLGDGTRYVLGSSSAQYIDRNGNTLNFNYATRQWTDTMSRVIGMPWPVNPWVADYSYGLPGLNGSSLTYTLKFRLLSQVLSPGNPSLKPIGNYYLPYPNLPPTDWNSNNFPQPTGITSLFYSDYADIENENSFTYVVGRGQSGATIFDPVVLAEIVLPNGQSYKFYYNNYGELDKVIYPPGAYERFQHSIVPALGQATAPYDQGSRGMTSRWVSPNGIGGSDESQWTYAVTGGANYRITVTAPNQVRTETYLINNVAGQSTGFGHEDGRNGQAYEERVYGPGPSGPMLRRSLTEYEQASATFARPSPGTGTYTAYRNARPIKTVSLLLDTGGNALTSASTSQYDATYQFSVGVDATSSSEYGFTTVDQTTAQTGAIGSIPLGSLIRTNQFQNISIAIIRVRGEIGVAKL